MQRWEYCVISWDSGNDWFISHYQPTGEVVTNFPRAELSKKIAELGIQGWELVNIIGNSHYFKRLLP